MSASSAAIVTNGDKSFARTSFTYGGYSQMWINFEYNNNVPNYSVTVSPRDGGYQIKKIPITNNIWNELTFYKNNDPLEITHLEIWECKE